MAGARTVVAFAVLAGLLAGTAKARPLRVMSISDKFEDYARQIEARFRAAGFRVTTDLRGAKMLSATAGRVVAKPHWPQKLP